MSRIIAYEEKTGISDGDYLVVDSFTTEISNSEKESIVINEDDGYMLIGGFNGFFKLHY